MIVYCAQSPSGRVYIGYTSWSLSKRKRSHQTSFENGRSGKIYSAFIKYGFESFSWSVLRECIDIEDVKKWEQFYIKFFNSKDDGYNLTEGGEGTKGYVWSTELKQQQSKFAKKQFSTPEGKKKCSEGQKKRWADKKELLKQAERMKKQLADPILRARIKEAFIGAVGKPVEVFKDGVLLQTFKSISEASRTYGFKWDSIANCINGKTNNCRGYVFRSTDVRKS